MSYSQLLILQDSKQFTPLHTPVSVRRKPIKIKNAEMKLTPSSKKPNKLILYEKKQLKRTSLPDRYSSRYNQQLLMSLVARTNQMLKPSGNLSKVRIEQKLKKDNQKSLLSSRVYTRAASPLFTNSFSTRTDRKHNPQHHSIKNYFTPKQNINTQRPEEYFKNIMKESIKKRTPQELIKPDYQIDENTGGISSPSVKRGDVFYLKYRNFSKSSYQSPRRPITSHPSSKTKAEKQIRVTSEALQPW